MIDGNGKLFGKISIVDIFVVLAIVGVIAGTVYKLKGPVSTTTGGDSVIHYTVKIPDVRSFTIDYYKVGLSVYDAKTETYIGKIDEIRTAPFIDNVAMSDGTLNSTEKLDKVEISLDISANGVETDQSYLIGGTYEIRVGAGVFLTTKYMEVSGYAENIWTQ